MKIKWIGYNTTTVIKEKKGERNVTELKINRGLYDLHSHNWKVSNQNYMTNKGYLKQDNKQNQCKATLSPNRNENE